MIVSLPLEPQALEDRLHCISWTMADRIILDSHGKNHLKMY
ncbi:hypothetical protein F383_34088 [Gossypium arboreum]|uniref:Uncharacterized protein n=1 Tax=Gossypium arboreum TaxID=29729 RepID=A0A0B0N6P4_GOSAR|nr:hypothetical protein F383_34088 [Gossypium arboreum]